MFFRKRDPEQKKSVPHEWVESCAPCPCKKILGPNGKQILRFAQDDKPRSADSRRPTAESRQRKADSRKAESLETAESLELKAECLEPRA